MPDEVVDAKDYDKLKVAFNRAIAYAPKYIQESIIEDCFAVDASAEGPQPCEMCGDAPCQGCNKCCGSKLGRDPEDGSCLGCG